MLASLERSRLDKAENRAGAAITQLESDKAAMDDLRSRLAAMQDREQQLLAERTSQAEKAESMLRSAIFAGGAFGLLGGILAVLIFTTRIARRVQHLEGEAPARWPRDAPSPTRSPGTTNWRGWSGRWKETSELLARQTGQLHAVQEELESRVLQRTAELEARQRGVAAGQGSAGGRDSVFPTRHLGDGSGRQRHLLEPCRGGMFGWTAAEAIGKPLPVVPEDQREEFRRWSAGFRAATPFPASSASGAARMAR